MLRSLTTQPLGKRLTIYLAERRPYNTLQHCNLAGSSPPGPPTWGHRLSSRSVGPDAFSARIFTCEGVFLLSRTGLFFLFFSNQKPKKMHRSGIEPVTCPRRRQMLRNLTTQPLGKRLTIYLAERRPYNKTAKKIPAKSGVPGTA